MPSFPSPTTNTAGPFPSGQLFDAVFAITLLTVCVGQADRDAMDMFRALVAKQEKSQRTLDLTKEIIQMNPGHYTVW